MDKFNQYLRVYPRLIVRRLRRLVIAVFARKPSQRFITVPLSGGAIMVWTISGNIVVTQDSARKLATRLQTAADIAEGYNHANP